jgi:hypothetical protein
MPGRLAAELSHARESNAFGEVAYGSDSFVVREIVYGHGHGHAYDPEQSVGDAFSVRRGRRYLEVAAVDQRMQRTGDLNVVERAVVEDRF